MFPEYSTGDKESAHRNDVLLNVVGHMLWHWSYLRDRRDKYPEHERDIVVQAMRNFLAAEDGVEIDEVS